MGAAVIVAGVAALLSAGSQAQSSRQQAAWQNYQKSQAEADAQAEKEARIVEAENIRRLGEKQRKAATASLAASGLEASGQGTPLMINQSITAGAEHDAYQTILTGQSAYNRGMSQAQAYGIQAQQTASAGRINTATSLLSAYGSYQGYTR